MIEAQNEEKSKAKEKQCHECVMCDKLFVLDEMMVCHRCNGMCLCRRCFCRSHNGHENQDLHDHIDTQVKLKQQWRNEKLAILQSLPLPQSSVFNRCKVMLDQHQAAERRIEAKRKEFEDELKDKNLNSADGYKFNLDPFEEQFERIEVEHKQAIAKRQELADVMSKMLVSRDLFGSDENDTGILFSCNHSLMFYSPNTKQHFDLDIAVGPDVLMGLLADDKIMVASGEDNAIESRIIDVVSKEVMAGPSMTVGRMFASSAMIGGDMYVCGGGDDQCNPLTGCEVYRSGEWVEVANMNVPRVAQTVVALNGLLYAIGGYNPTTEAAMSSVECYSPDKDSWGLVASLNQERCGCLAAALNGCIYVAGGGNGNDGNLKSCERYDPKENKWERVADMNKERHPSSLVSMGGKLYALGGDEEKPDDADDTSIPEYSVESYDPVQNEWKMQFNTYAETSASCEWAVVVGSHLSNIIRWITREMEL